MKVRGEVLLEMHLGLQRKPLGSSTFLNQVYTNREASELPRRSPLVEHEMPFKSTYGNIMGPELGRYQNNLELQA
jgi:hypothetical protein